ncbi:hypothetical protein C8R21_101125 [Nitrosospira multiformis]|uniref:Uncharacterized protein n=1 Tax=Nitrosospira multiformis TaxID=1231 RepID=A0A2T5IHZ6_9PROT|nr:hypothetical protein [Nitrosospira multiformis]PTQ83431.1 hypothetical protein C8R21_101125 [Nitrosospira multiformis]
MTAPAFFKIIGGKVTAVDWNVPELPEMEGGPVGEQRLGKLLAFNLRRTVETKYNRSAA